MIDDEDDHGFASRMLGGLLRGGGGDGGGGSDVDEDDRDGYAMRDRDGDRDVEPGEMQQALKQDIAPSDSGSVLCDDSGEGDPTAMPAAPKPPADIDFETLLRRYCSQPDGRVVGWTDQAKYAMFPDNKPCDEFCSGGTTTSVAEVEAVLQPFGVLVDLRQNHNPDADMLTWGAREESRLAYAGVFLSGSQEIAGPGGILFNLKIFHVHWRFFVIVVLSEDMFLGYHYYALDRNAAITNKCL